MKIRAYKDSDRERLKEIAAICFDGVSIDQNIERTFGVINGRDWRWRKQQVIDDDLKTNPSGVFVAEEAGVSVGFITTHVSRSTAIGWIRNFAVLPAHQKQGIGRRLLATALTHLKASGMQFAKIETLEQNAPCRQLYPAEGFQEMARNIHYVQKL